MKEILEIVIKNLVNDTQKVSVTEKESAKFISYVVKVA